MSDPTPLTIDSLPSEMIEAIRHDAELFPGFVQSRGREYYLWDRVGPLEIEPDVVRATVRGTRKYRTAWRWDGEGVDPRCTCPVGPVCKHAYALARAILVARGDTTVRHGRTGPRSDDHRKSASHPRLFIATVLVGMLTRPSRPCATRRR